jgi:hypothetical protein
LRTVRGRTVRHLGARRFGAALSALLAAGVLSSCGLAGLEGDKLHGANEIIAFLGDYEVIALGPSPIDGVVGPRDVNDDLTVVGTIGIGTQARAFAWKAGVYSLLATTGASPSSAVAVNSTGQIVGNAGEPVVWATTASSPVPLFPEGSPYRSGSSVDIDDVGAIMVYSGTTTVLLAPGSHAVELAKAASGFVPRFLGNGDEIVGVDHSLYATLIVLSRSGASRCAWWQHGTVTPGAVNDAGEVLSQMTNTAGEWYNQSRVFQTRGGCAMMATLDAVTDETVFMRTMNNGRVLAGTVGQVAAVMKADVAGHAPLDLLLDLSSGDSREWHVTEVQKITNGNAILAVASKGSGPPEPVLLVPRGK